MRHRFDRLKYEHAQFILWAHGWVTLALVFAGIAFIYGLFCFLSRDEVYRSQRYGASISMMGQLVIAAYWSLQAHPVLHFGAFDKTLLFIGIGLTFIGWLIVAQKQNRRTWLWF